jgi:hypothetical protein
MSPPPDDLFEPHQRSLEFLGERMANLERQTNVLVVLSVINLIVNVGTVIIALGPE